MLDYIITNNRGCRFIFAIFDNFSKCPRCIPLKSKNSKTITEGFSTVLTVSKRSIKLKSDRGAEFYNSIFQSFLLSEKIHQSSRFTDKGTSKAERVIRTIRNF